MMPDNNASNRICDKGTRVVMPDVSVRHMSASRHSTSESFCRKPLG